MQGHQIILSEHVLYEKGPYRRVRRWIKGKHPDLGPLQIGWSGDWETIVDTDVLIARGTFEVRE